MIRLNIFKDEIVNFFKQVKVTCALNTAFCCRIVDLAFRTTFLYADFWIEGQDLLQREHKEQESRREPHCGMGCRKLGWGWAPTRMCVS